MTITIGALTSVPSPGDDIRSPWAQDLTRMATHTFATKAALDAATWPGLANGMRAYTTTEQSEWVRVSGAWYRSNFVDGQVTIARRFVSTIIPASGSQLVLPISGWAAEPTVSVTLESTFDWRWRIGGITTSQVNVFVLNAGTGAALPDSTAVLLNVVVRGPVTPGSVPTV